MLYCNIPFFKLQSSAVWTLTELVILYVKQIFIILQIVSLWFYWALTCNSHHLVLKQLHSVPAIINHIHSARNKVILCPVPKLYCSFEQLLRLWTRFPFLWLYTLGVTMAKHLLSHPCIFSMRISELHLIYKGGSFCSLFQLTLDERQCTPWTWTSWHLLTIFFLSFLTSWNCSLNH